MAGVRSKDACPPSPELSCLWLWASADERGVRPYLFFRSLATSAISFLVEVFAFAMNCFLILALGSPFPVSAGRAPRDEIRPPWYLKSSRIEISPAETSAAAREAVKVMR